MNQRLTTIVIVLLILTCALTLFNTFYQNNQIKEAIDQLEIAEEHIVKAILENDRSTQLVSKLRFEIQRTSDSLDILLAERDSIILSYKRWGSDEQYIRYNKELRSQTGKLEALRRKYNELIDTKNISSP